MFLQSPGKRDIVEVVKAVNRVPQCLVIFFFNEQIVVCVVDRVDIELQSGD